MNAIYKWLVRWLLVSAVGDEGGGGEGHGSDQADAAAGSGAAGGATNEGADGQGVDAGAAGAGSAGAGAGSAGNEGGDAAAVGKDGQPGTMLDAIKASLKQPQKTQDPKNLPGKDQAGKPQNAQPDDDPTKVPPGLTPEAHRRFTGLVTKLKDKDGELVQERHAHGETRETLDGFRQLLSQNNVQPDQFSAAISVIGLVQSGDPVSVRKARDFFVQQARELSLQLGEAMPDSANDILAEFPDLQQKVAGMQMTEQDAIEIARYRRNDQARQQSERASRENAQQKEQERVAYKAAAEAATSEMTRLETQWRTKDIDYKPKMAKIVERLPDIIRNYPPTLWVRAVSEMYQGMSAGVSLASERGQPAGREPRPLHGGSGGPPAPVTEPKTMHDAIMRGLGRTAA